MQHYLEADCGVISALTAPPVAQVRQEVERRVVEQKPNLIRKNKT